MKRILAFILTFMCVAAASAEGIEIQYSADADHTAAITSANQLDAFTMEQQWINGYAIATFTWSYDSTGYACCIGGLSTELTEVQAREIAGAYCSGVIFELEGSSLVDAEKATNKLPVDYGVPVWSSATIWNNKLTGDSSLCWAGSLSDMLQITGWGKQAINPETGAPFANEDELFTYFSHEFNNLGSYQYDGAGWFFSGAYERDTGMADLINEASGGLLPGIAAPVSKAKLDEAKDDFLPEGVSMLSDLSMGGVVGLDIHMNEIQYPLKDGSGNYAAYVSAKNSYVWEEFILCDEDEILLTKRFTYDDQGQIVFADDDADGADVMVGQFIERDGRLYPVSVDEFDSLFCNIPHEIDPSELDMTDPDESFTGSHALTAIGYICSADDPSDIGALLIIDSDNDAHIYSLEEAKATKRDRPNKYTIFYTCRSELNEQYQYPSIALADYYGKQGTITGITLLKAFGE